MARRTTLSLAEPVDALSLVASLRARDPDAYQFALVHPTGAAFVGSTPERLFSARDGHAASEAVAGTRPRGADEGEDAALAYEMLLSAKEHEEFAIVREEVRRRVGGRRRGWFPGVRAELEKGVLRHVSVQHLYARLGARLGPVGPKRTSSRRYTRLPAVCGYPRAAALDVVRPRRRSTGDYTPARRVGSPPTRRSSPSRFDRRWSNRAATSYTCTPASASSPPPTPPRSGTNSTSRRVRSRRLRRRPSLAEAPNANRAWAEILVGELVRGGVRVFCVAPGSRSTPLALAAEQHPTARVRVCVDERSLAFYALRRRAGSGRASAVITSSGTAVANLLPAAVEAHESCAPLLLLTADRPPELRDTGANQTIDQTKIFGAFAGTRWISAPPGDGAPARVYATAAAAALRHLHGDRPGPVHVNCQFRDPLGPVAAMRRTPTRDLRALDGLERAVAPHFLWRERRTRRREVRRRRGWRVRRRRRTARGRRRLRRTRRAGSIREARDSRRRGERDATGALAAAAIAETLGWAVVADAASGVRVRGRAAAGRATASSSTASSSTASSSWSPASAGCPHVVDCAELDDGRASSEGSSRPEVVVQQRRW